MTRGENWIMASNVASKTNLRPKKDLKNFCEGNVSNENKNELQVTKIDLF